MGGSRGGDRGSGLHPVKSDVFIGFLSNFGTKQLDPLCPIACRGRSVRPSVKYVDDKTTYQDPHSLTCFSASAHGVWYANAIITTTE